MDEIKGLAEPHSFKRFRIGDLFEKIETNKLNYSVSFLKKTDFKEDAIPALTAGSKNQGLTVMVPRNGATVLKNVISISANGKLSVFYQPYEFTVLQDAYAVKLKDYEMTDRIGLYLSSVLTEALSERFDWGFKSNWGKVKEEFVRIPVTILGEPDYAFMERFIWEIEKERIRELEDNREKEMATALKILGISSCNLTKKDEEILEKKRKIRSFKLAELFDVTSPPKFFDANKVEIYEEKQEGSYPYIVRSAENNGMRGYIKTKKDYVNHGNTLTFAMDTFKIFYQHEDFVTGKQIKILVPRFKGFNEPIGLYVASLISEEIKDFCWGMSSNKRMIGELTINLPVTDKGTPDYLYMENFIRAIQKNALTEHIEYLDRVIAETKRIVVG